MDVYNYDFMHRHDDRDDKYNMVISYEQYSSCYIIYIIMDNNILYLVFSFVSYQHFIMHHVMLTRALSGR